MPTARMLRLIPREGEEVSLSDEELVAAIGRNDSRAARQLYERVFEPVDAALCRVLGRRQTDHEDLMQRSFELLFSTLVNGRFAAACSLPTWASAIAARVALEAIRKRRREHRVIQYDGEGAERAETTGPRDLERELIARRKVQRVRRILSEMSPERAEALVLHDVLGHSLAEIAALTGTTVAAAQSRLVRGRKQFRERATLLEDG